MCFINYWVTQKLQYYRRPSRNWDVYRFFKKVSVARQTTVRVIILSKLFLCEILISWIRCVHMSPMIIMSIEISYANQIYKGTYFLPLFRKKKHNAVFGQPGFKAGLRMHYIFLSGETPKSERTNYVSTSWPCVVAGCFENLCMRFYTPSLSDKKTCECCRYRVASPEMKLLLIRFRLSR